MLKRIAGNALPRLRDYVRLRRGFKGQMGYAPNILFPKTLSEKIQRRKLFDRDPRLPLRADKIAVKDFVREKLGEDWITPTLWYGTLLPPQPDWPIPFVLKASHGSGMNLFVRSADDWKKAHEIARKWLAEPYYASWGGEWLYSQIEPRLLIEPFIGELAALPIDYKLWTFHGRVEFIQVDTDREHDHKRTMFSRDWQRLPFTTGYPMDERKIRRPASLKGMIAAAEIICEDIFLVRTDFYELKSGPRFGEMTFYPGSGCERFLPEEYNRKIGKKLR